MQAFSGKKIYARQSVNTLPDTGGSVLNIMTYHMIMSADSLTLRNTNTVRIRMKVLSSFPRPCTKTGSLTKEGSPSLSEASDTDGQLVRKLLRRRLGGKTPEWFTPLSFSLEDGENRVLTVSMPHELFFRWYAELGRAALEKAAYSVLGSRTCLRYEWPQKQQPVLSCAPLSAVSGQSLPSFDDFLVGGRSKDDIRLLRTALQKEPRIIFLRGAPGTGKTHLARAAFGQLRERFHGRAVFLSGSEMLTRFRRSPDFFQRLARGCDALVADDLQLLEKAPDAQRELASLLDMLSDKTFFLGTISLEGTLIAELNDRLCSSLSLLLPEPDLDVRLRFAQQRMEKTGLPPHRSTALMLARRCLSLRHIRGILEQLRLRYEQNRTLPSAAELAHILERSGQSVTADADTILSAVAAHYGCTSAQLRENTRNRELSHPRQIAMYLCRSLLGESYPALGLLFGGKDHTTVMYAVKKIEKLKVTNKDVHSVVTKLTKQCANGVQGGGKAL